MASYQFYGGPADGSEVPRYLWKQDYVLLTRKMDNIDVTYYYVKCEDHPWFEYAGEVEENDSE